MLAMFGQQSTIGLAFLFLILPSIATSLKCLDSTDGNLKVIESTKGCVAWIEMKKGCSAFTVKYMAWPNEQSEILKGISKHEGGSRLNTDIGGAFWTTPENSYACAFQTNKSMAIDGSLDQFKNMLSKCVGEQACKNNVAEAARSMIFAEGGVMDPAKLKALKSANSETFEPEATTSYSSGYTILLSIIALLTVF